MNIGITTQKNMCPQWIISALGESMFFVLLCALVLPHLMPSLQRRLSPLQDETTDIFESISRVFPPHTFTTLTDHILHTFTVVVTLP